MKPLLTREALALVRRLTQQKVLLAFDFDGTLAPIVARPGQAALRPQTRRMLRQVARLYPCVVISGRARADLNRRLTGLGLREVVGNHGIEESALSPEARKLVEHWRRQLEVQIDPRAGIVLEDKGATLAVHYRNARRPLAARRAILKAVSNLRGARIVAGKMVVDLLPRGTAHKGAALTVLRRRAGCQSAIYVGDDQTDEDAFALGNSVFGVRVGRRKGSQAQYYLRRQDEIDGLLAELIAARTEDRRADQRDSDDKRLMSPSMRSRTVARRRRRAASTSMRPAHR